MLGFPHLCECLQEGIQQLLSEPSFLQPAHRFFNVKDPVWLFWACQNLIVMRPHGPIRITTVMHACTWGMRVSGKFSSTHVGGSQVGGTPKWRV